MCVLAGTQANAQALPKASQSTSPDADSQSLSFVSSIDKLPL